MAGANADEESYSGLFTAIPYALRSSRSWLFRLYTVVGGLVVLVVTLLMVFALVTLIARTGGARGGSLTLSRAFYVVVGMLVVGPLLAPMLLVARRHRIVGSQRGYDALLALAGFVFLLALYVGLVISVPPAQQQSVGGALAPVVETLYALPPVAGLVPPALAAALIALAHRLGR